MQIFRRETKKYNYFKLLAELCEYAVEASALLLWCVRAETSVAPETPVTPGASEASETPDTSGASEVSEMPTTSGIPAAPEMPAAPGVPAAPDTPAMTGVLETPVMPTTSEVPETPVTPGTSEEPEMPTTSECVFNTDSAAKLRKRLFGIMSTALVLRDDFKQKLKAGHRRRARYDDILTSLAAGVDDATTALCDSLLLYISLAPVSCKAYQENFAENISAAMQKLQQLFETLSKKTDIYAIYDALTFLRDMDAKIHKAHFTNLSHLANAGDVSGLSLLLQFEKTRKNITDLGNYLYDLTVRMRACRRRARKIFPF